MYGDDLLVAPVTEPEVIEWTVYLPGPDQAIFQFEFFYLLKKTFLTQIFKLNLQTSCVNQVSVVNL